jgi:hypothetical protein
MRYAVKENTRDMSFHRYGGSSNSEELVPWSFDAEIYAEQMSITIEAQTSHCQTVLTRID